MTRRIVDDRAGAGQGSPEIGATQVDVTREAIVERCASLERVCPAAVDLDAEMVAALHQAVNGHAVDLAGNRSPKDFREALRGARALTGEDVARLAIQAPAELVAWVRPLLLAMAEGAPEDMAALLAEVSGTIAPPPAPEAHEGISDVVEATSHLVQALVLDAKDDGQINGNHAAVKSAAVRAIERATAPRVAAHLNRKAGN